MRIQLTKITLAAGIALAMTMALLMSCSPDSDKCTEFMTFTYIHDYSSCMNEARDNKLCISDGIFESTSGNGLSGGSSTCKCRTKYCE
jgi:hypothetical protein